MNPPVPLQPDIAAEYKARPRNRFRRAATILGRGALFLALVYLVLLIPEPRGSDLPGAGKLPFVWKQDHFWSELETQFIQARAAVCPQRLNDYIALATRARSEAKIQSLHWDLNAPSPRQRLYRLLFGTRMAL